MTEKELRNLSRQALLELLVAQTERADKLEKKLSEAEKKLRERAIAIEEAGSIAEAALRLNGIFEAAEAAAGQYLENIKSLNDSQEEVLRRREEESRLRAEKMIEEANIECRKRELQAEMRLAEISAEMLRLYNEKRSLDRLYSAQAVKDED